MAIIARVRLWLGVPLLMFCATALADNAMTTEPADLYAGPDDAYPVVAQLDPNTPIQVMGCLDDWSWCDVVADGARGWMYAPDITYAYEGGYVPLYSYAPSLGIAIVPFSLDVYWGRYYHERPWYRERDEWARRSIHHRRPSGPPPSAGPPPRPERREGPREGPREAARPDNRDLHLGSAQPPPPHREDEHNRNDDHKAFRRPESPPPPRPAEAPPRPETRALPPPGPAHAPAHEPSPPEERSRAAPGRAAPPPREERPREEERPH